LLNSDSDADNEYAIIRFNALADNSATGSNDAGDNRDNAFSVRVGSNSPVTSGNARVTIAEPALTINKTASPTSADAGDTVAYRITLTNANGANNSTAFETVITDALPVLMNLNLGSVTVTLAGGAVGVTDASAGNTITLTLSTLPPGGSVILDYTAMVDTAVSSGQVITNTATALYTSLPLTGTVGNPTGSDTPGGSGATNGERAGSGSPTHNDHRVADPATVTITVTPVKSLTVTSEAHTIGSNVAIGEITRYRLAVALPESTALNLQLRDNLPTGLRFLDDGTATVAFICNNGASCISSSTLGTAPLITGSVVVTPTFALPGSAIGGGPFGSGVDPTFSLGDATNTDNDADQEFVVVEFNALTENVAGNQTGAVLTNPVPVRDNGGDVATSPPLTVAVVEPTLTLSKQALTSSGDAGDTIGFLIEYTNTAPGNATAFDVVLTDVLPANMTLVSGTLAAIGPSVPDTLVEAGGTITATWAQLAVGDTGALIFNVVLSDSVTPGQVMTNTANMQWTSLPITGTISNPTGSVTPGNSGDTDGERNGNGGLNDHRTSDPASVSVPNPTITKAFIGTSAAHTAGSNVVIGEIISYSLMISLPEGTTPTLVVTDALPSGLAFVSGSGVLDLTGFGGVVGVGEPVIASAGGSGDDVTFTFASPITVTADNDSNNDRFSLRVRVQVLNVAGNQNATVLPNSATLNAGGGAQTSNTVNATVREPVLTVSKAVDDTTPAFGQVLTYTLTLTHAAGSTADALDLTLTDILPGGLTLVNGSASVAPVGTVTESAGSLVVSVPSIALGNGSTITYRATVGSPPAVNFGTALTNTVNTTWTSLPGGDPEERTGTGGVNDYVTNTSRTVTVTGVDLQLDKTDNGIATTPGGTITYTLTVTNTGSLTATGVLITDSVPANTSFVSASNGGAESGGVVSWPVFSLAGGASVARTLIMQVGDPLAATVTTITNTASVTDDGAGGPDPTPGDNGDSETTPVSGTVDLQLSKDDGQSVVTPGQTLTYTLVVTNVGNVAATGVRITDTLPTNVSFVSASNSGAHVAGVVMWPAFTLNGGGASTTRSVTVQVNNPLPAGITAITNTTIVNDDGASGVDPTPADNGDSDTDTLTVSVDLRLSKRAGAAGVAPGDLLTYTLTYTNVGNVAAIGVTITETVPANTTFNAAGSAPNVWSCADGSAAGATCTLNVGTQAGGNAGGSVRFAVRVDPAIDPNVTQITNTALISDDGTSGADPTPANNNDNANSPIVPPTAVTLLYFRIGSVANGTVRLEWATAAEVDNFGFKLYRAASNDFGAATEIVFVPALGSGSSYAYADMPGNGNWWYWLVDVNTSANETPHGPVTTAIGIGEAQAKVYLPVVQR
ncbi:MAG: beta strand repeat-containing protein, partial [Anaerolineales bacterium]